MLHFLSKPVLILPPFCNFFFLRHAFPGLGNKSEAYQVSCLWNPKTDPYCPVFRIQDILGAANIDEATFNSSVMVKGAVVVIQIQWVTFVLIGFRRFFLLGGCVCVCICVCVCVCVVIATP